MTLRLFDSGTQSVRDFVPLVEGAVGINVETVGKQRGYASGLSPKYLVSNSWPPSSDNGSDEMKHRQRATIAWWLMHI